MTNGYSFLAQQVTPSDNSKLIFERALKTTFHMIMLVTYITSVLPDCANFSLINFRSAVFHKFECTLLSINRLCSYFVSITKFPGRCYFLHYNYPLGTNFFRWVDLFNDFLSFDKFCSCIKLSVRTFFFVI